MTENLQLEKDKILKEIEEERLKLLSLEEANINKSFALFFVKPLFGAFLLAFALKFLGFDQKKLVGSFILIFFVLLFFFSYKTKKDFDKRFDQVQEEKIKIQAQIFTLAKRLRQIDERIKANKESDL
ncbi:MAG: SoxR reducing system RseC family protein [Peptoniphilaceae bacterium]|nr:SoxR reducing system RseC family protein [Peptoniphilaceae bacterium]MDY6018207.1 SoxR reducing system RseC family protein [Anaerococcus sp.]